MALAAQLHESRLATREATHRLEGAEQEAALLREQTAELRRENSGLAAANHALEKAAGTSRIEVAALSASTADKDALVAKTSSLLEAAADARRHEWERVIATVLV